MKRLILLLLAVLFSVPGWAQIDQYRFTFQVTNNGTIVYTRSAYARIDCDGTTVNCALVNGGVRLSLPSPLVLPGAVVTGTSPAGIANTAVGGFGCTEATNTGWTPTAGTDYIRCDNTLHTFVKSENGGGETALGSGSGTVNSGTAGHFSYYATSTTAVSNNANLDDGVTTANALTYAGTAGVRSPAFTATGTTAGFVALPQGTTSAAVAPCNVPNTICEQAPTAVTSQLRTKAGTPATGFVRWTNAGGTPALMAESIAALANTDLPTQLTSGTKTGIFNFNVAAQSQVVVSATEYYVAHSDLDMPAAYTTAIAAGTTMHWRLALTKTAAGTGTFQILLKKGTNGTTGDTSIVTQTIGTQTAVVDNMEVDISLTWTSATAAYWTIVPRQSAASGTGFGLVYPATAAQFTGTISAQTTTTASDKYGISVIFTTGTPTFVVNEVFAQAFGVN